jgi:uncharacterized protein (DUF58 family)
LTSWRRAATSRLRAWSARRHGRDSLPVTINRRRIYILPTRYGLVMALLVVAMLIAGLNYNSNLGLAFAFLMASVALVAMHHCHRNLLGLGVDVSPELDAFAGGVAVFDFALKNYSSLDRYDIEIRCAPDAAGLSSIPARSLQRAAIVMPVRLRGLMRIDQIELRTRHPFGWFRAWTYLQTTLCVYAAPGPAGERLLPAAAATVGNSASADQRGDEDFAGLRAYEPGLPLKHMAWKVLARGGEPVVRSYTALAALPEWLEWSALDGLDTETRLSQLCQWVLECDAAQHRYGLRIPGLEIVPALGDAHRRACLRALAVFADGGAPAADA